MLHGYFSSGTNVPRIEVAIFSHEKVLRLACILDTGFSGYLKIDEQAASDLGIVSDMDMYGVNANGEKMSGRVAYAYVELEKRKMLVEILIFNGPALAGIGLFASFGYKVVVDCKNKSVHLESAT